MPKKVSKHTDDMAQTQRRGISTWKSQTINIFRTNKTLYC